jgi:hypothetical protein
MLVRLIFLHTGQTAVFLETSASNVTFSLEMKTGWYFNEGKANKFVI